MSKITGVDKAAGGAEFTGFKGKCLNCQNSITFITPASYLGETIDVTCAKCKAKLQLWPKYIHLTGKDTP